MIPTTTELQPLVFINDFLESVIEPKIDLSHLLGSPDLCAVTTYFQRDEGFDSLNVAEANISISV